MSKRFRRRPYREGEKQTRSAPLPCAPAGATLCEVGKQNWNVILRCHSCRRPFTVSRLPIERVALLPQITPCPHCAARPIVPLTPAAAASSTLHQIIDLRQDHD